MICCHFFCSHVFSMPVCRNPIVGLSETMFSPSSSSTRFSTPCVLGCWGPMFTVIDSVRSSGMALVKTPSLFLDLGFGAIALRLEVGGELLGGHLHRRPAGCVLADLHRVVLA